MSTTGMSTTGIRRLLSWLNRPFDKRPSDGSAAGTPAFLLNGDGTDLAWTVAAGRLTTAPAGGTAAPLTVVLAGYTIGSLAAWLAAQPGYTVTAVNADLAPRSALILIEATGTTGASNGNHLYAFESLLWVYLGALARELAAARAAIVASLQEMSTAGADGEWLDLIGSYYGVTRQAGETDGLYGPRIITEVEKAKGNNKALELALGPLADATAPAGAVQVTDAPLTNGSYGWFDITASPATGQALDFQAYTDPLLTTMNRLRDAGTNLRTLSVVRPVAGSVGSAVTAVAGETTTVNPAVATALAATAGTTRAVAEHTADIVRIAPAGYVLSGDEYV